MSFDGRLLSGVGVLAAVVEAGSFVRAAESLGLTQSGVSRAVARLEERVQVRLFHRTPRQVTLTDEGRRFYDEVAPLLAGIEDATAHAAGSATAVRGKLRVSSDATFAFLLAPRLHEFLREHPELSFDLLVRDQIADPVAEGIDVAIRFGEPEASGLIHRLLLAPRVLTCAAPSYLQRHPAPLVPEELLQHECLLVRNPVNGRPFEWELHRGPEKVLVAVRGRLMLNEAPSVLATCLAGHGISQMFEYQALPLIAEGRLVQVLPEWSDERFPVYFYHRSRQLPSARVRAFIEFLLRITQDHQRENG